MKANHWIIFCAVIVLFAGFFGNPLLSLATTATETNNELARAAALSLNSEITNTFASAGESNWYKISLNSPGLLQLSVTHLPNNIRADIRLYNRDADYMYVRSYAVNDGDDVYLTYDVSQPGTYFIKLQDQDRHTSTSTYTLGNQFTVVIDAQEPNNEIGHAFLLNQSSVQGYIFDSNDQDWFKIYGESGSQLAFTVTPPAEMTPRLRIYDSSFSYTYTSGQSVNPGETLHVDYTVPANGLYYIRLNDARGWSHVSTYTLAVTGGILGFIPPLTPVASEVEPNDELKLANLINLASTVSGKISPAGDHDWYQFNVPQTGRLNFELKTVPSNLELQVYLYDSSGNQVLFGQASDSGLAFKMSLDIPSADVYYLRIRQAGDNDSSESNYTFSLTLNEVNDEFEPNDNYGDARLLNTQNRLQAYIFPTYDEDWYRVTVSTPGNLHMVLSDLPTNLALEIRVFNMSKNQLSSKSGNPGEDLEMVYEVAEAGDYLIRIRDTSGDDSIEKYTLTINGANFNSYAPLAYIDSIVPGAVIAGDTVTFTGSGTDNDGTTTGYQWRSDLQGNLSNQQIFSTNALIQGTHTIYFKVQDNSGNWSTEVHDVVYVGTSVSNEVEPNSSIGMANEIALNRPFTARIDQNRDNDYYKIYIDRPGHLTLAATNVPANLRLYLEMYNRHLDYLYVRLGAVNQGDNVTLEYDVASPGFYYLRVTDRDGNFDSSYAYTLKATLVPAVDAQEPNDAIIEAFPITTSSVEGYIFPSKDQDWFKVWVNAGSTLTVEVTNVPADLRPSLHLYNRNLGYMYVYFTAENDGDPAQVSHQFDESGYVYIKLYDADSHENWTDKYRLTVSGNIPVPLETSVVAEREPNDEFADANLILLDKAVSATIDTEWNHDWFKFNLTSPSVIQLQVENIPANLRLRLRLYQADYGQIGYREATNPGDALFLDLTVTRLGLYLVRIDCPDGEISDLPYVLKVSATTAVDVYEPNDSFGDAAVLKEQNRIQALIFPEGDEDWYRVTSDAGSDLEISIMDVPAEILPVLEIFNTNGSGMAWKSATNDGQELTLTWQVEETGDYLIRIRDARGYSFSTQAYTLIINGAKFNTYTPLAVIDSVSPNPALVKEKVTLQGHGKEANNGSISGYVWRSSLDGAIGSSATLTVSTLSKGVHTIYFKVIDANQIWSPETSTLLYVGMSAPGEQEPNDDLGDVNPIEFGVQYSGTMDQQGDGDYFKVHIPQAGQLVIKVTNPVGSTMRSYVETWTDNLDYAYVRIKAANDGDPVTLTWDLTEAGDYYLSVSDTNGSSGNKYTLTATFTPCPDPYEPNYDITHATLISPQETLRAYIFESGDEDWYKVNIDKPGLLGIALTSMPSDLRGYIETWDPNLSYSYVRASANNDGDNVSVDYQIENPGTYFIRIKDRDGHYNLETPYTMTTTFESAPDPFEPNGAFRNAKALTTSPIQAYIFPSDDVDIYRFYAYSGQNLKITADTVPTGLRLNLRLYDANQDYLYVSASSPAEDSAAVLEWTVKENGWYYVTVTASDGKYSTSPYQLSITGADLSHPTTETPVSVETEPNNEFRFATQITSGAITGSFTTAYEWDWFKFDITKASVITLALTVPSNIRSEIYLYDGEGSEQARRIAENVGDFSKLVFTISEPGTYYVRIRPADGEVSQDPYQLNLTVDPVPETYEDNYDYAHAAPIQFGQAVDAMIYPSGNRDWFKVHNDEPGLIRVELNRIPDNIQIGFKFYNENYEEQFRKEALNSGDPIEDVYLAPEAGNWYIMVYDRGDDEWSVKPYRLTVYFTPMVDADEPSDSFGQATLINDKNQISGLIYPDGDIDWFRFYVSQARMLKVQVTQTAGFRPIMYLYNDSKEELERKTAENIGDGLILSYDITNPDWYYLRLQDPDGNHHSLQSYVLTFEGVDAINSFPMAQILSLTPGLVLVGQPVIFKGLGTHQNGTVSLYEWSSDKDGLLGRGETLTLSNLSVGDHIISLKVQDSQEQWSGLASAYLHVANTVIEESEYNNSLAEANPVPLNTWIKGRIYPGGDKDYYKIYLDRRGKLTPLVDASLAELRPYIEFYNLNGDYLYLRGYATNPGDLFTFDVFLDEGWYLARITDKDGSSSDLPYGLWFGFQPAEDVYEPNDTPSTATPISLNTVIRDAFICKEGDEDWYALRITETGRLSLSLTSMPEDMIGYIELYNANLDYMYVRQKAINSGDNVYLDFETNEPGIYYIKITDSNGGAYTKPYTFTSKFTPVKDIYEYNDDAGHATQLTTAVLDAYIFPGGDVDWYWIYATSGTTLTFGVTQAPEEMNAWIGIYDPNQGYTYAYASANNDGDNIYVSYDVPADGIYYIKIKDNNNWSHLKPYHLTVSGGQLGYVPPLTAVTSEVEPNSSYAEANYIALSTNVKGTINPADDTDWFKFYINSAGIAVIAHTAIPSDITSEIWVYNANLNEIDYRTTTNAGEDNILTLALTEPGYYWIEIVDRDYDNASAAQYNLRVTHTPIVDTYEPNDNFASGTLVGKSTVTGYIFEQGDQDWYRLFVRQPGTISVSIDAMPIEIRPHLELYDADKNHIDGWLATNPGQTGAELITYDVEEPGFYFVRIWDEGWDEFSGTPYTLRFTGVDFSSTPLLSAIGDQTIDEGIQYAFTVVAVDPNPNDTLIYSASNLPPGATFDALTRTFKWMPAKGQAGIYTGVHFAVSDGTTSASEDLTITVNKVSSPPKLAPIGNKTVRVAKPMTFQVSASDLDGDPLTFNATYDDGNLPSGAVFTNSTKTFTWTPTQNQVDVYEIKMEVSDGVWTDFEYFTITVSDVDAASYPLAAIKAGIGSGTVASAPSGLSCGANCSASIASGAVVTLTATPENGSIFTGWSGDCYGTTSSCTVTMDAAKNVTAGFTLKTYNITLSTMTNGSISCSPMTVNHGINTTCTISPSIGYRLVTLTDNGSDVISGVTGNTYVIKNVTANHTIGATFGKLGDINNDGNVSLTDAIMVLQIMCGIIPAQAVNKNADVNGDKKIGMAEAIFILQKIAQIR